VRGRSPSEGEGLDDMLRSMCTKEVFERGVRCFEEGGVKNIDFSGQLIRVIVQDRRRYRVTIAPPRNSRAKMGFACTCSYRYGECCGHVVAALIAISEELYDNEARRAGPEYPDGVYAPQEAQSELGPQQEEDEIALERPLDLVSKAIFARPLAKRRGRKTTRIRTCLDSFLKSMTRLEAVVVPVAGQESKEEEAPKSAQPVADPILSEFATEDSVRRWAEPENYLAGLQCYGEARLSHRTVSGNVLSAVVNARRKGKLHLPRSGVTEYSVSIKVTPKAIRGEKWDYQINGHCDCPGVTEGEVCAHVVALLIAWLRKPAAFEILEAKEAGSGGLEMDPRELARRNAELGEATYGVLTVLQELLVLMEDQKCSKNDTITVLETIYSRVKLASVGVEAALAEISTVPSEDAAYRREAIVGFSVLLNAVSLRLFAAVEMRWKVGATALLNGANAVMTGRLLGALANMADTRVAAASTLISGEAGRREDPEAAQESPTALTLQSAEEPVSGTATSGPSGDGGGAVSHKVSRSWDGLLEEFTRE
jgi:SWIM zinc finger